MSPDIQALIDQIAATSDPQARVQAIYSARGRIAPNDWPAVCAAIADACFVPNLAPTFHFIPFPPKYADEGGFKRAYDLAARLTQGFTDIGGATIADAIRQAPATLRIFRLIAGYSPTELAATIEFLTNATLSVASIERLENGGRASTRTAAGIAAAGDLLSAITGGQGGFAIAPELRAAGFRSKSDKPDTREGWRTVAKWHGDGVPYSELLYQRFFGGSFRQVQDAGGYLKGDLLEDAVDQLFVSNGVPFLRTTSDSAQRLARETFGVTVTPAPDFIPHDTNDIAKALLECKSASDGGTARDKAARFRNLKTEGERLSIPVIAVIEGFGWRRTSDALGPVVASCDGRVFSLKNLSDLLRVEPITSLLGLLRPGP